jgi:hypothetical protein
VQIRASGKRGHGGRGVGPRQANERAAFHGSTGGCPASPAGPAARHTRCTGRPTPVAEGTAWAIENLRTTGSLSQRTYASALAVSVDTALSHLRELLAHGRVRAEGTTKDCWYVLRVDEASPPFAESAAFDAAPFADVGEGSGSQSRDYSWLVGRQGAGGRSRQEEPPWLRRHPASAPQRPCVCGRSHARPSGPSVDLKTTSEQKRCNGPNVDSLIEALFEPRTWFRAI